MQMYLRHQLLALVAITSLGFPAHSALAQPTDPNAAPPATAPLPSPPTAPQLGLDMTSPAMPAPQPIGPDDGYETVMVTKRYGGQILLADAAALGLFIVSGSIEDGASQLGGDVAALGAISYALTPALVHAHQGNSKGAWKSVGLRLGLPVTGMLLGVALTTGTSSCNRDASDSLDCGLEGVAGGVAGILVGMVTASVIDAAVLAEHTREVRRPRKFNVAPTVAPRKQGVVVGLVGEW